MEDGSALDATKRHEEVIANAHGSQNSPLGQPTYRSFRKKFRKMKHKFDEAIQQSKDLYFDEQRAILAVKRLAHENDQILDLLYDVNNCAQIPDKHRIDLDIRVPSLSVIPALVNEDEIELVSGIKSAKGQTLYKEICSIIEEREESKAPAPPKSLSFLMGSIPHLNLDNSLVDPEVIASLAAEEGQSAPYGYLTPDQIDEYNHDIDASLGLMPPVSRSTASELLQDPVFGNFHSPYNWLRRHVPQIFLQDNEGSEKSNGKPGSLRGAGKRASMPAPSKPDALEIVEEDGLGYDFALGGATKEKEKKRKRDDDDQGYTPKRGVVDENKAKKQKQARKKKAESSEEKSATAKKSKRAKNPSLPPGAHPFGPA